MDKTDFDAYGAVKANESPPRNFSISPMLEEKNPFLKDQRNFIEMGLRKQSSHISDIESQLI
jgi:hypothetical protein